MEFISSILDKLPIIVSTTVGICSALIGVFLLIPGDSPEKELQAVVDFLAKFSKK